MAYPDNLLVQGERVIVRKRPHWKVLILPTVLFIVIIGAGAALAAWINSGDWEYKSTAIWVIVAVAVIALIVLVLVPFIRWRTEHFVITNHHVFFRTGLLSRREHQIPLGQIANMETEVTFWGRLMGYGSLIVESSADQPLKFRNVASLSKVQAQLNQLIRDEREATHQPRRRFRVPARVRRHSGLPRRRSISRHPRRYPPQGYAGPAWLPAAVLSAAGTRSLPQPATSPPRPTSSRRATRRPVPTPAAAAARPLRRATPAAATPARPARR